MGRRKPLLKEIRDRVREESGGQTPKATLSLWVSDVPLDVMADLEKYCGAAKQRKLAGTLQPGEPVFKREVVTQALREWLDRHE